MGRVNCRIWALVGNIGPVGGPAQIGRGTGHIPLWDGRISAGNCDGRLRTKSSGGIGLSLHRITASDDFNCDDHCEFSKGDEITVSIVTLLFVTVTRINMSLCTRGNDWHIGLGLGLGWNGAVWEVV